MITAEVVQSKEGLTEGTIYEVEDISMGQSYTSVYLKEHQRGYNSVYFEFYENDQQLDIFKDKRFNPYIRIKG